MIPLGFSDRGFDDADSYRMNDAVDIHLDHTGGKRSGREQNRCEESAANAQVRAHIQLSWKSARRETVPPFDERLNQTFFAENVDRPRYTLRVRNMAKKQAIANETAAAAATATARAAKTRAPRVTAAQHSKTVAADSAMTDSPVTTILMTPAVESENREDAIARIAYGYWEARGCQGGSAVEDWARAEQEYQQLTLAAV